jgi:hypothetical protein
MSASKVRAQVTDGDGKSEAVNMAINFRSSLRSLMALLLVSLPIAILAYRLVGWVTPAAAQTVSIDIFFEPLAPHGRWLRTSRYGYVWVPARIAADWRPYTYGHWEYSRRFGWVWVSDEDWGWATYHYGRWGYDDDYGWFWVPGNHWAPAWVSWQSSDDYYGWAPLPPSGSGYAFSVRIGSAAIGIGAWRFVSARDFLSPDLGGRIITPSRNSGIIRRTRPAGPVRVVNNVVVNNVISITNVEKTTRQKVVVRDIREVSRPQDTRTAGDAIQVYRPQISNSRPRATPKDAVQVKTITDRASKVEGDAPAQGRGRAGQAVPGQPGIGTAPVTGPVPTGKVAPEPGTGKATPNRLPDKPSPKATVPAAPKGSVAPIPKADRKAKPPPSIGTEKRASPPPPQKATPERKAPSASRPAPKQAAPPPRPDPKVAPAAKALKDAPSTGDKKATPQREEDGRR